MSDSGPIYLDYNATAPIKPEVVTAVSETMMLAGNPSSVHGFGRDVRKRIEDAREQIAALIGCSPPELVFTAGGTEANNTALSGAGRRVLIVSAIEHPAVLRTAEAVAEEHIVLPVDGEGLLDLGALDKALAAHGPEALVSVMLANNETGVIQPVAEIAARATAAGALVHCDAVQAPGRIPVSFAGLGVDMMSIAAHKFAGPKGIGALVVRSGLEIAPLIHGGGQERGLRGGTENAAGIVGFGTAAQLAQGDLARAGEIAALRDRLEARLRETEPDVVIFSEGAERLSNTSCLTMPGVQSETQVMGLDLAGVAVSAGSACSSGKVEPSHVLRALGAADAVGGCAIRRQPRLGHDRGGDRALPGHLAGALCGPHQPLEGRRLGRCRIGGDRPVPTMTFIDPDGTRHEVEAPIGDSVLDIAFRHGIDIEGACEGAMACSTCHVIVDPAWFGKLEEMCEDEEDMLDLALGLTRTSRLGCQIVITEALDGLVVTLPDEANNMM